MTLSRVGAWRLTYRVTPRLQDAYGLVAGAGPWQDQRRATGDVDIRVSPCRRPRRRAATVEASVDLRLDRLRLTDQLLAERRLAVVPPDGDDLVPRPQDGVRAERHLGALADHRVERAAVRDRQVAGRPVHRRRVLAQVRLDDLELAPAEPGQVKQVVDGDVLLDRAKDHAGRADDLVDAEVAEQLLVLRVVHPRDRARHVEVVFRHLADDEIVLVVAGDGRDDVRPVRPRLAEVLALAAVVRDHDGPDLVRDLRRARGILLEEDDLVARLDELFGEVEADLSSADDEHEHGQSSRESDCRPSPAPLGAAAVVEGVAGSAVAGATSSGSRSFAGRIVMVGRGRSTVEIVSATDSPAP